MASQIQNRSNPLVDASSAISALAPVFLGSGATTTKTSNLDPKAIAALQQMLAPGGAYGKGAAVSDSNDAIANAMKLLMEKSAPGVISQGNQTGGYGSTTQALEMNDLTSRIAGEGAQLQLNNIGNYAGIQNQAANTLKGANTTSTAKTAPIVDPWTAVAGIAGASLLSNIFGSSGKGKSGSGTEASIGSADTGIAPVASKGMMDLLNINSNDFKSYSDNFAQGLKQSVTGVDGTTSTGGWDQFVGVGKGVAGQIVSNEAGGILSRVIGGISDLFSGGGSSSDSSSGCFITTAVCRHKYKADDCDELTTLRTFRDTYMRSTDELRWYVDLYYRDAPGICKAINAMKDDQRNAIYAAFDEDFIQPAVIAIKAGDNERAFNIYRALFEAAKEIAFPVQE